MSSAIDPEDSPTRRQPPIASDRAAARPGRLTAPDASVADQRTAVERQRDEFGGMKIGCAFFGWLAATGMAVLLTALLAATGAALGLTRAVDVNQAAANPNTIGLVGGIVVLVVVFIAYYCGGYVAGRMARFHGLRQGVGVWLWAVVIAVLIAILGLIAGTQFDVLARLNGFPRIPINEGTLTLGGVLVAIGVAVVSLVAAIIGGLSGMRFHRRVDRAGTRV